MRAYASSLPLLVFTALLASASSAEEASGRGARIAMLDLTPGRDVDPHVARSLSEVALTKLQSLNLGDCIGWTDVKELLTLEMEKQLNECANDSCMADIGGALGVELMISGNISRIGSQYVINLKLLDVRNARAINRISRGVAANEDALLSNLPDIIAELVKPVPLALPQTRGIGSEPGQPGILVVRSSPDGSTVKLAGKEVGTTPLRLPTIEPGTYEIEVAHRDYSIYRGKVSVAPGPQQTIIEIALELDYAQARRNYEFTVENYNKEVFWQRLWGGVNTGCGSLTGALGIWGTFRLLTNAKEQDDPFIWIIGPCACSAGVLWAGYGIYKLFFV
ncbi:MAG: PEGA domain-containing protein, partial [Deltaproteobacteria bacterium]|nr:PEGA domain-containing protein [Deltaproteobacteria bacterium]